MSRRVALAVLAAAGALWTGASATDSAPGAPAGLPEHSRDSEGHARIGGCDYSVGMGALAAVFFVVLPVNRMLRWRFQRYHAGLLSAPESRVMRAQAIVRKKEKVVHGGASGSERLAYHYLFTIEFTAERSDGSALEVTATTGVEHESCCSELEVGALMAVLYPVDEEGKFEIVNELIVDASCSFGRELGFVLGLGLFSLAGLSVAVLSCFTSTCDVPLGIVVFGVCSVLACSLSFFCIFPLCQALKFRSRQVETRPTAKKFTPILIRVADV